MESRMQDPAHSSSKGVRLLLVGISLVLVAAIAAEGPRSGQSISQRVQALVDRAAIERLITSDYSTALDNKDWKAFGELFTEDGEFSMLDPAWSPKNFKGREAIAHAFTDPAPTDRGPGVPPASDLPVKHVISNPHITIHGDNATATAYWMEMDLQKLGSVRVRATGYYIDVLKRDNGVWRFKSRQVHNHETIVPATSERLNR